MPRANAASDLDLHYSTNENGRYIVYIPALVKIIKYSKWFPRNGHFQEKLP